MRTAVIILNWNTEAYLRAFLPGLLKSCAGMDAGVIVADSGSEDASLEMLSREFPKVMTVPLGANKGFTGGYNEAVRRVMESCAPEFIVLINSDVDVPEGWLQPLVDYMDSHQECGACGPKLLALDAVEGGFLRSGRLEYAGAAGGYVDRFGFPFCRGRVPGRTENDCGQYETAKEVLWVSGACLMTRSRLWERLGGLDERFFAHMEEIDYCWRLRLKGWSVCVVPQSKVWHLGGGTLPQKSPFKLKLNYRNNLLLLESNLAATVGPLRARLRIATRKALDLAAAAAYLVMLKPSYAAAVINAHKEARKLRRPSETACRGPVKGYMNLCILPLCVLKGKGIFKYIRKYENSH